MLKNVVIVTTTLYNSKLERDRPELAKETIKNASELGYEIIVFDGGSTNIFLKEIKQLGANVYSEKSKSMGEQKRKAIRVAYDTHKEIIAWTEPEKLGYISEIIKTAKPILNCSVDLVVPRRKSLSSYPKVQQHIEYIGNRIWNEITGKKLDIWFGPRTWKRDLTNYFLNYNGEYGDLWESMYIPVLDAIFDDKIVEDMAIDYINPKEQTRCEENNIEVHLKRIKQLQNISFAIKSHMDKKSISH